MIDDARLHDLRRLAFGRTHTPEEETAAAAARLELEAALAPPPTAIPVPSEALVEPVVEVAEPRPRRSWIGVAAAALVVGALVGAGATALAGGEPGTPVVPVTVPTSTFTAGSSKIPPAVVSLSADQPVAGSPGDVAAALLWFENEQDDDDIADDWMAGGDANGIVASSTRLVYSSPGSDVWIAQSDKGELCLIATSGSNGAMMCTTPEEFVSTGIPLHVNGNLSVVWNGQRIVASTNAGERRDVRP